MKRKRRRKIIPSPMWEELGFEVNKARLMLMQSANGLKEAMEGCAEFLELEVGGMKTWAHALIVPNAPFRLIDASHCDVHDKLEFH